MVTVISPNQATPAVIVVAATGPRGPKGDPGTGGGGGGAVASVNAKTGVVVLTQDDIASGTTAKQYTATEQGKLAGISAGATVNQTDATTNAAIAAKADSSALTSGLAGKANTAHTHSESDITNLTSDLAAKYVKPGSGIPSTDLTTAVQTSLGKADSALQSAPVTSVASKTGAVSLDRGDVGLGNVDNTADSAKPVSTAQQTALNQKQDTSTLTESVQDIVGALLVAGTNVTLNYDDAANTLTVNAASGGGGGLDLEAVQDAVAAMTLTSGTGLSKSYDDPAGTMTLTLDLSSKQDASAALSALAALATSGSIHRTGANTYASRTLTGSTYISVTNGDGVAGNPTVALTSSVPVANGGTGRATSTTAYGIIAAGTTATGAQQTVGPGASGQFMKSAGAAALGTFANIVESDVTNLVTDLAAKAPLASPTFTGDPQAPTPAAGDNDTSVATTAFVQTAATNSNIVAVNAQNASYTIILSDANKAVEVTSASATTVTVPPNSSVAYPVGTVIEVDRMGAGSVTLAAGVGVTLQYASSSLALRAQYSALTIRKRATDTWLVTGDLT